MKNMVWKFGVRTYGVRKRSRKIDFHSSPDSLGKLQFFSGDIPRPNFEELKLKAYQWLNENMKSYEPARTKVTASLWEIDGNMERWEPFNDAHNLSENLVN